MVDHLCDHITCDHLVNIMCGHHVRTSRVHFYETHVHIV